jgi:uncharacterized protein
LKGANVPKRIVIIHGSYGSPSENWFPWLARQVRGLGHEAVVPQFPTPEHQTLKNWLKVFDSDVGKLTPNVILIGHSLGVGFILRILELTKRPVAASFLVSAFLGKLGLPEFDKVNADFVTKPVNWKHVRATAGIVRVYNGDNDPYVPLSKGQEIAKALGVQLTVVKGGGHINAEAGYTQFSQLLDDLKGLHLI